MEYNLCQFDHNITFENPVQVYFGFSNRVQIGEADIYSRETDIVAILKINNFNIEGLTPHVFIEESKLVKHLKTIKFIYLT